MQSTERTSDNPIVTPWSPTNTVIAVRRFVEQHNLPQPSSIEGLAQLAQQHRDGRSRYKPAADLKLWRFPVEPVVNILQWASCLHDVHCEARLSNANKAHVYVTGRIPSGPWVRVVSMPDDLTLPQGFHSDHMSDVELAALIAEPVDVTAVVGRQLAAAGTRVTG